jgi:fumarate hydratase subunit alpha/L(+)-tartrate dehydratase alpha subunit
MKAAIRRGCERATREHPLRSSIVHPLTRRNEHTSCGIGVPVIHIDYSAEIEGMKIEMIPKGSGSENNSWLKMAVPAEGVDAIRTFVVTVLDAGEVSADHRRCRHRRHRGSVRSSRQDRATRPLGRIATIRRREARDQIVGRGGLLASGRKGLARPTAFAVHEIAATHITMNPVAVNM